MFLEGCVAFIFIAAPCTLNSSKVRPFRSEHCIAEQCMQTAPAAGGFCRASHSAQSSFAVLPLFLWRATDHCGGRYLLKRL